MTDTPPSATVVSGFLGAGKTTLVNHLLAHADGRRLGVLVNDFGAINIDSKLIVGVDDDVISLSNGCICCTMKNDVVQGVLRLTGLPVPPEHIIVETSGVSDPGTVAQTFMELQRQGHVHFDGVVALVDAEQFSTQDPEIGLLARCQILAADLVVLNKIDLVDEERRTSVREEIREHVPHARIVEAENAVVPNAILLASHPTASDDKDLPSVHMHVDETAHDGLRTFRFESQTPMAWTKLAPILNSLPSGIYRAKGFVDLVERPGDKLIVHVVGRRVYVRTVGEWGDEAAKTTIVMIGQTAAIDEVDLQSKLTSAAS